MSTILSISGKRRERIGSSATRRLRAEGLVPCNVYGHKQDPVAIVMDHETIDNLVRTGSRVVDLSVDGNTEKALVKEVQWDTFTTHVLHVDFLRVDPDERVQVEIPLQMRGSSPGVTAGGVLEIPHHTVMVECLAVEVPDHIQVRIGSLNIGDMVHVSDLKDVPVGVTILTPEETVLVHIVEPKATPEPGEEAAAEGEPEVISEGTEEGKGGEEG